MRWNLEIEDSIVFDDIGQNLTHSVFVKKLKKPVDKVATDEASGPGDKDQFPLRCMPGLASTLANYDVSARVGRTFC